MRVKGGNVSHKRHKKILKLAKGFRGSLSRLFVPANQAVMKALRSAYRNRRTRRREMRRLWITRINAAARLNGMSYNQLICGLKKAQIDLNRKMLADLAVYDAPAFAQLVGQVAKVAQQPQGA